MDGLRLFSLPAALVACGAGFLEHRATDARAALAMVRDASDVLAVLLEGGHGTVAGRLAGAFRNRPYLDGNGRMGRFLMNVMPASGGYPWTVIPVERRNDYMAALEAASVEGKVVPFVEFLAQPVTDNIEGKPGAKFPRR